VVTGRSKRVRSSNLKYGTGSTNIDSVLAMFKKNDNNSSQLVVVPPAGASGRRGCDTCPRMNRVGRISSSCWYRAARCQEVLPVARAAGTGQVPGGTILVARVSNVVR
jgi:hypothetical protein